MKEIGSMFKRESGCLRWSRVLRYRVAVSGLRERERESGVSIRGRYFWRRGNKICYLMGIMIVIW